MPRTIPHDQQHVLCRWFGRRAVLFYWRFYKVLAMNFTTNYVWTVLFITFNDLLGEVIILIFTIPWRLYLLYLTYWSPAFKWIYRLMFRNRFHRYISKKFLFFQYPGTCEILLLWYSYLGSTMYGLMSTAAWFPAWNMWSAWHTTALMIGSTGLM